MSKQHPKDAREPRDIHTLIIIDTGWDEGVRTIETHCTLSAPEERKLQQWVTKTAPEALLPLVCEFGDKKYMWWRLPQS